MVDVDTCSTTVMERSGCSGVADVLAGEVADVLADGVADVLADGVADVLADGVADGLADGVANVLAGPSSPQAHSDSRLEHLPQVSPPMSAV